ncbi:hypothetical protein KP509_1Z024400 [Ceratopteris richardii]|nr:hypothetical protein KP509_1Z024400 [Ceratopteris richardii]KAH6559177.1 hypothetical protein KP509_1Z024400 [Ceratopteris richardii]KAH6559178.1 hypothetical protein KP509_1Z024400 [Ceratopteris richardii]KAH6559179.1 hypothetical protein KP509_1Z024400 [Ceratopteris richardii]KAH6559180.1 hypothetical protein KP509_1Z024400 [Ceratopteris richardii]
MAVGRQFRNDKRMPSFYVMATIAVFVALCLLGMWMLSSPPADEVVSDGESIPVNEKQKVQEKKESYPQQFEESPGNVDQETDTNSNENPDSQDILGKTDENKQPESDSTEENKEPSSITDKEKLEPEADVDKEDLEPVKNPDKSASSTTDQEDGKTPKEKGQDTPSENESEPDESSGTQSELRTEEKEVPNNNWQTQASESKEEKEKIEEKKGSEGTDSKEEAKIEDTRKRGSDEWVLCDFEGAADYIPCLDNKEAIRSLPSTSHYEHRERHCPASPPTCVVPLPKDYHTPMPWPKSRDEIWFSNVPYLGLASYKKDQNWVKKSGDKLIFPGGGTQFKREHGAVRYIEFIQETIPDLSWGNQTRVILDVGCGVASFGGYLFDKDVLAMSFAPKDEHEAQIQFALERGIPAISAVMGTQRLVFPSNVFDAVHCARCRVPWHIEGGKLLLELNRVLRPGGYFLWSATPVYWKDDEDVQIWKDMASLTAAMCWELVAKTTDPITGVGLAVFQKPSKNSCYENRKQSSPPLCDSNDKPDAAWYTPMTTCLHKIPQEEGSHGVKWPQEWPLRLTAAPTWLEKEKGVYGKQGGADFRADTEYWQHIVSKSYLNLGIEWSRIRNVMDMRAVYGGFAAALASKQLWVMNVVPFDAADTLPIIFDRGLFGIYHDWCESFSSYPRTYDLLHVNHLLDKVKNRCSIKAVIAEMDRLLRPEGWAIFREKAQNIEEVETLVVALHWDVRMTYTSKDEGLLAVQKTRWRPQAIS